MIGNHDMVASDSTPGRRVTPPAQRRRRQLETVCELCGGPVLERHCKIICLNCGFQRDCSDP